MNRKLKICNAADNADITQSQARDTRHRRMQEVNSLCTDSGPLRANTVLCYSTTSSAVAIVVKGAIRIDKNVKDGKVSVTKQPEMRDRPQLSMQEEQSALSCWTTVDLVQIRSRMVKDDPSSIWSRHN